MQPIHNQIKSPGLGTFAGVFTPSALTILGIILFLRLGYVVGNAGLFQALVIIALANLISVLTSFSLAAIATNMKVKGGGDYYLISRTLGTEFGGALGLVLFLAQSVSIAFYCIGFGEAVTAITGGSISAQAVAGTAVFFLFLLAWVGADLATKFQFVVMTFLVLALGSFYIGGVEGWQTGSLVQNWAAPGGSWSGFWPLFALFFPAVTGFTQGVSMSGDLKDPGKSLPAGTFAAVGVSIAVYLSVAVVFAAANPLGDLASDYTVMNRTAKWGWMIDAGVIAATLSSAMASFLGAPRILQSLASDRIFPFLSPFAKGSGKNNNPRRGVLLSLGIAVATILLGQLDLIAGVVSMFFLISYGLLNYATYFEASSDSPSFRPKFRFYDKRISLMGALGCLGVMLAIDLRTGVAAAGVLFAVYQYLKRKSGPSRWADSHRSHHLREIRENLLAAREDLAHPREWRPFILAVPGPNSDMGGMISFAGLIEGNSGITTVVKLIQADEAFRAARLKKEAYEALNTAIQEQSARAFPLAVTLSDPENALPMLFQSFGIGPVRANTLLAEWNPGSDNQDLLLLKTALRYQCNVVLLDHKPWTDDPDDAAAAKEIHVWWKGDDTSRLIILLAYLITRNSQWDNAVIRLIAFESVSGPTPDLARINAMLEDIRINAVPQITAAPTAKEILRISGQAHIVFMPVYFKEDGLFVTRDVTAGELVPGLNQVAFAMAALPMDLDSAPEEGEQAETARLLDEIKHARQRVDAAQNVLAETLRLAEVTENEKGDVNTAAGNLFEEAAPEDDPSEPETVKKAKEKVAKEKTKLKTLVKEAMARGLTVETSD
ncbi:MAG TPA: amino acid permease [Desulfobacteraceae bacterium]|nr:amino acid permease [Desulfobacteraceae bacterium]